MNKFSLPLFLFFVLVLSTSLKAQNVGINSTGASPDASAMLDVSSTTSGMLIPRLTQTQRTSISSPAIGLLVYQTDNTTGFYYYTGSQWLRLAPTTEASLPYNIVTYTTGSGTYTPSVGTKAIMVKLVGGGGAGGSADYSNCAGTYHVGTGGGAGGYCEGIITTLSSSYSYTVGIGGVPSSAICGSGGGAGGAGGTTTFGTFVANGGGGGYNSYSSYGSSGGSGGTASGGNINITGAVGGYASSTSFMVAGYGAPSYFGGGAVARTGNFSLAGYSATSPGSGGGGASSYSGGPYLGGNGAAGIIIIYEYK